MLRHLVGDDLEEPGTDSLRTLVALVEPVKQYKRGGQQPKVDQRVPLAFLADAARPDSTPSREFAAGVEKTFFGSGAYRPGRSPHAFASARALAGGGR